MRKFLIFSFIFSVLLAFSVFSENLYTYNCSTNTISDDFSYSDAFTSHGWSATLTNCNSTPLLSPAGSNAFGIKLKNAGSTIGCAIYKASGTVNEFPKNYTANHLILSFSEWTVREISSDEWNMYFYDKISGVNDRFIIKRTSATSISTDNLDIAGMQACAVYSDYQRNNDIMIDFDLDADTYDFYLNGLLMCDDYITSGTSFQATGYYMSFTSQSPAGTENEAYLDDLVICNGTVIVEQEGVCSFPTLFCDDFDRTTPLIDRWTVLNTDSSSNSSIFPANDNLEWLNINPRAIGYEIEPFPVNYYTSQYGTVTASLESPVFSTEFKINIKNDVDFTDDVEFTTADYNFNPCVDLLFSNSSGTVELSYVNTSSDLEVLTTLSENTNYTIKIIYFFGDQNKNYPFNSSTALNYFVMFIDGSPIGSNHYFDDQCQAITSAYFKKYASNDVYIDNYYQYVGTDKYIDTSQNYFTQIYDNTTTTSTAGETGEDMAVVIDDFWESFGLKSTRSKFMFGLMMLFLVTIFTIGMMLKIGHVSAGGIAVVDTITMILLTFMGLMPVWIVIVVGIIAAGVGFLMVKGQSQ